MVDIANRWRDLKPEERVQVAIGMADLVVAVSAENERERTPEITKAELIARLRKRFQPKSRTCSR